MRQLIQRCRYMNFWLLKIPVAPHPPYSSDLALCNFFLFLKLKFALKGSRFQDLKEIKVNTTAELKVLISE